MKIEINAITVDHQTLTKTKHWEILVDGVYTYGLRTSALSSRYVVYTEHRNMAYIYQYGEVQNLLTPSTTFKQVTEYVKRWIKINEL